MRKPTADDIRRDQFERMVRRTLALVTTYQELADSYAASGDVELAKRMLSTRGTVLALVEASMPTPIAASPQEIEAA